MGAISTPMMAALQAAKHNPLRTVAQNCLPQGEDSLSSLKSQAFRMRRYIVGGDVRSIVLSFHNWMLNTTGDKPYTTNLTVDWCWVICNGTAVQVTFSGASTKVMPPNSVDIHSDELLPSAFGLSRFAKDSYIDIRGQVTRSALEPIPCAYTTIAGSGGTYTEAYWFDSAATTITNPSTLGAFTRSGTAGFNRTFGYAPIVLGDYIGNDYPSWVVFGDSIQTGYNESASISGSYGIGYVARALFDESGLSTSLPYLMVTKPGAQYTHLSGSNVNSSAYYKYARFAYDGMGTNDFGAIGSLNTAATVRDRGRVVWAEMRGQGVEKIVRGRLLTRTTSTDLWATTAGQTLKGAGWGSGGNVEQFHTLMASEVSGGYIDQFVSFTSWLNPENNYFWPVNGTENYATSDEVHPSTAIHALLAAELKPILSAYA